MCVASVKDISFVYPRKSKRLKELMPQPLSEFEQREALSELRKILPNAPLFIGDNSDTDTASMLDKSHQNDPVLGHHELSALGKVLHLGGHLFCSRTHTCLIFACHLTVSFLPPYG